jgi:biopolymer transport protein ExbB/TolQ
MSANTPGVSARRTGSQVLVFVLGLAATFGVYAAVHEYAHPESLLVRYVAGHWVEYVETWLFLWAMLAIAAKVLALRYERAALATRQLPRWHGEPVPVAQAEAMLQQLNRLPRWWQGSMVVQRLHAALGFVQQRGSTEGLDDQLRALSDADANQVEGSYGLLRFITWAIPILGFLGTVLGITEAIANVTPEQLATSISSVTDGLAIAFDTTALALAFSMCVMFLTFVLDRTEQSFLHAVDVHVEQQLAHRFERGGAAGNEVTGLLRGMSLTLLQTVEKLVQRQADLWSHSLEALQQRWRATEHQQQRQLTEALGRLLEQTTEAHQRRLGEMESRTMTAVQQMAAPMGQIAVALQQSTAALESYRRQLADQTIAVKPLLEAEQHILRLQQTLQANVQALVQAGTLQEGIHALTAAVHLLTAHAAKPSVPSLSLHRPGNAA